GGSGRSNRDERTGRLTPTWLTCCEIRGRSTHLTHLTHLAYPSNRASAHCAVLFPPTMRTREILPVPLSASQRSPFLSMSMFRTVPPPPGIGQVRNFFVSGLKRTSTFFASSPVSTYQTAPSAVTSIA